MSTLTVADTPSIRLWVGNTTSVLPPQLPAQALALV